MSVTEQTWVTAAQYRSIQAGLRVVGVWAAADHKPEAALDRALRREPEPADVVIGLATVARLLALELAAATGATETAVLKRLTAQVERMQHGG